MSTGSYSDPLRLEYAHAVFVSLNPGDAIASDSVAGERADDGDATGSRARSLRRGRSWRVGRGAQFRHRVHQHDLERRSRPLSRAGHSGRRVPSHGRGSRIQIRAHRRADVRGRPHPGPRLSADGRHPARSRSGPRGTAAARSRDERRRTRRDGDDRPGNPAQRPPLHRSRIAGARIGGAVANRLLEPADPRHRRAGVQYRRQPRRSGRLHRQRREHHQHGVWTAQLCAAGRQHPGVQDRQLDVQRRVRPRVGRDRQPGHALGHRPVPRRGLRILPSRRARRAQLLRVHHAGSASVRAPPVRRRVRRSDRPQPHVLLCHVRRPAPAPGYRHERRGAQRRPACGRDGSGGAAVDPADPARQLFRCRRHAAVRRRRERQGRPTHVDRGRPAQCRDARSPAGVLWTPAAGGRRANASWASTFPASACGAR